MTVARTVISDVPDDVDPTPVALMAKLSLPLYLAFALYSYVVKLIFFNFPWTGFCEMSELFTVPCILIGNRQLCPETTSMSLVELSPQSARVADTEQSEAARAKDTDIEPIASTISAKATSLDIRVVDFLVSMQNLPSPKFVKLAYVHCRQSASYAGTLARPGPFA